MLSEQFGNNCSDKFIFTFDKDFGGGSLVTAELVVWLTAICIMFAARYVWKRE